MAHWNLIALLKRHEGFRSKPYRDTAGKLTIGYGRNLDDTHLSTDEATFMLENDVHRAAREVKRAYPWVCHLDSVRAETLIMMVFNLGLTRFGTFTQMLQAAQAGDYDTAADEMLRSLWAEQVGERARELAGMMRSGRYKAWEV